MESNEKECPFCAETIKAKAKICRFCQRELPPDEGTMDGSEPSAAGEHLLDAAKFSGAEGNTDELQKLADECGIEFDGEKYRFCEYKYDKLLDALNYARLQYPEQYNWHALDVQLAADKVKRSARPKSELVTPSKPKTKTGGNLWQLIVSSVVAIVMVWYFFGGGLSQSVANDFVAQYRIARQSGSAMDACVHAGIVAAAYLQAHDQTSYETWKGTERNDCFRASLSH